MRNQPRFYIDFHVLQTVPPSCVNRDDTGSPKTCVYGGAVRARVSSQAWKRAIKNVFLSEIGQENMGYNTKYVKEMFLEYLGEEANAGELVQAILDILSLKNGNKDKEKLANLLFISDAQAKGIADVAITHREALLKYAQSKKESGEKKEKEKTISKDVSDALKEALKNSPTVDMALFGRMVASDPDLNYDAAAQVAHSISTHAVQNEYDYFTALDDRRKDETGAGYLDTAEFNSSTLYRYATVNVEELAVHLKGDTAQAVRGFADAFIKSMPTGKQNSFANRTLPSLVYVAVRGDQPVNLAPAFETPVRMEGQGGYAGRSAQALAAYAGEVYRQFVPQPEQAFAVGNMPDLPGTQAVTLAELLDKLQEIVDQKIPRDGGDA